MANPPSTNQSQKDFRPFVDRRADESLEWDNLMEILQSYAQTQEGKMNVIDRLPLRDRYDIEEKWRQVDSLRLLAKEGFPAPIGDILPIAPLLKGARLGQILDGSEFRAIYTLLDSTQRIYQFARDFESRTSILSRIRGHLIPLPQLQKQISKTVGPDGLLLDDASEKLTTVRRQKVLIRRRIEESLGKLLQDAEVSKYLQDTFWTVRNDRYVVPIRLDGRGRVRGSIRDTSDSGQTLFIEPVEIVPINDQLLELELEEKLEIARIFSELTGLIADDSDPLLGNYQVLVQLDQLTAEAMFAVEIDAGMVQITDEPKIDLIDARHPLIRKNSGRTVIGNSIRLEQGQSCLIVSGPNAGGKTVVLKTIGIIQRMAQTGLLVPADAKSQLYLFERIFVEMGDHQNLAHSLSTFSAHLMGLKPILETANSRDLVLLDELAVGTDPETGAAFAAAFLEELADRRIVTLVTTHFDALKGLALKDNRFRNGCMEFSLKTLKPTYRLILDVPGQSYGLEVAEQIGFPQSLLERAHSLKRGGNTADLNRAISDLMAARDEARLSKESLDSERLKLEGEQIRWEQEIALVKENRKKITSQLKEHYESQIEQLRRDFDDALTNFRTLVKGGIAPDQTTVLRESKTTVENSLKRLNQTVSQWGDDLDSGPQAPGKPVDVQSLKTGDTVYVVPLKKTGIVLRLIDHDTAEVNVGMIKMRLRLRELRKLSPGESPSASRTFQARKEVKNPLNISLGDLKKQSAPSFDPNTPIKLVIQSHLNTLDLRGMDSEEALKATWIFFDRSLMRGEEFIILLHGHGEGILKQRIRDALKAECPYDISFRAGYEQEGGDGVTVVRLNR